MSGVHHALTMTSSTGAADPLLASNVLLLKTIATNNATNATFVDSSSNGFTVTRTGDVTQGAFSPYAPTGYWSNYFDGSGDWLRRQTFNLSGKPVFTAECWFNPDRTSGINSLCGILTTRNSGVVSPFNICHNGSGQLAWLIDGSGGGWNVTGGTVTAGQWHHVAISSDGTTIRLFLNGTQLVSYGAPTWSGTDYSQMPFIIGANLSENHFFQGFISNARFIIGTAVYTSNFTPPTTPLTAITNTVLLTCQDNRFIDRSSNNFTLTRTGDVSVRRFAPFGLSWDGSLGGSGYFDGSGDQLNLTSDQAWAFGTGAYCIEMWVYPLSWPSTTYAPFIRTVGGANGFIICNNGGQLIYHIPNVGDVLSASLPAIGQWSHIVVCRNSTTVSMFVNGAMVSTTTSSHNHVAANLAIGGSADWNTFVNSYITNLRIVKGSSVYDPTQTTLTVPTSPLTAVSGTSLLLNFDNAAVYDATRSSNLSLVGDTKTSTGQVKYATTSSLFDGTGDYATILPRPELAVGTGDFTWEAWIRPQTTSSQIWFASPGNGDRSGFAIGMRNGTMWWLIGDGSVWVFERDVGTALSTNNWHHVAFCRSSGTARLFVNGSLIDSIANTTNIGQGTRWDIGGYTAAYLLTGNMEDLRVSRTARYTAAFTPPARALPVTAG